MIIAAKKTVLRSREDGVAKLHIPPSKSHSIRALILAALADAPSEIENILISGDTETAASVIRLFGAKMHFYKNGSGGNSVSITPPPGGIKNALKAQKNITIDAGNSGSVFYFLGVILAFMPFEFILTGDASLQSRPADPLLEIYRQAGIKYEFLANSQRAPLKVYGTEPKKAASFVLNGDFSQPVTGLLIAAAASPFDTEIVLRRTGELPYLKMTLEWLAACGIKYRVCGDFTRYNIEGGQNLNGIKKTIPADWSGAAFPLAAAAVTGSELHLPNLDMGDVQGDKRIIEILQKMGVSITAGEGKKGITVKPSLKNLIGGEFDCSDIPDAVPALSAVACFAQGKTVLKNILICRSKECDRIAAVVSELKKLGARITEGRDYVAIEGRGGQNLHAAETDSHNDHRIGLMLAVAALGIPIGKIGKNENSEHESKKTESAKTTDKSYRIVTIRNAECFRVSYPAFIKDMNSINAGITILPFV